ncbi:MAG: hypothetical protein V1859_07350 [archaeon]
MARITKKTKFFEINYLDSDKTIEELFSAINKAENKYYNIFKIIPKKYKIIVCYTREEFDKFSGIKSEIWHQAMVINKKKKFVLFSPSVRDKLAVTKLPKHPSFESLFDHEINHIFYITYVGNSKPLWLCEGYATYMMDTKIINFFKKQIKIINSTNKKDYLLYRPRKDKYNKYNSQMYVLSTLLVGYLIEKYGHEKLILLIKEYKKVQNRVALEKNFKDIYGFTIKEVLKKAI